jgi:hypothetical protein
MSTENEWRGEIMKRKTMQAVRMIVTALFLFTALSACGGGGDTAAPTAASASLSGTAQ